MRAFQVRQFWKEKIRINSKIRYHQVSTLLSMKTDGGTKIIIQNIDKYMQEEILADPQNSNWSKTIEDTYLYKEQTNEMESLKQILKNKYVGLEYSGDPIGNSKVKQIEKDIDDAIREFSSVFQYAFD